VLSRALGASINAVEFAVYSQPAFPTAVGALVDVAGAGTTARLSTGQALVLNGC
jgi:5-enolpyruvylshikimate-3-phosphate synthase